MKTLNLGRVPFPDVFGGFGSYHQLKHGLGVKVLHEERFSTLKALMRSEAWQLAGEEAKLLKRAEPSGITPRSAQRLSVRLNGHYWAGIRMEHIEGLWWSHRVSVDAKGRCVPTGSILAKETIKQYVNRRLAAVGLKHLDITNNWLVTHFLKICIIDFTPEFIKVLK